MKNLPKIGITLDRNEPGHYSQRPYYALRENYCTPISDLGGVPMPIPPIMDMIAHYLSLIDGLIITGGDFDIDPTLFGATEIHPEVKTKPIRTQFEMLLCTMALAKNMPILGICGGAQIINVCLGGTLIQHIPDEIPNALNHQTGALSSHSIKIEKESMLSKIFSKNTLMVNSSHHQSINISGKDLIVSAIAEDNVVEAIELKNHPFCIGVQWHPEFLLTPEDNLLFKAFMNAI